MKRQNAQEKSINKILRTKNIILGIELEKDKKREHNIIKDIKTLFRLKKENESIKDIINLFRLKKENGAIKGRMIRDIRNLFEQENEDCYKSVRVGNFWS